MKHTFPEDECVQELTVAQRLARAYLIAEGSEKAIIARRLAYEVLGHDSRGRYSDVPVKDVDGLPRYIPFDEPVFLMRAEHPMTLAAVQKWLEEAEKEKVQPEILALVRKQIREMVQWPVRRLPKIQKPSEVQE